MLCYCSQGEPGVVGPKVKRFFEESSLKTDVLWRIFAAYDHSSFTKQIFFFESGAERTY